MTDWGYKDKASVTAGIMAQEFGAVLFNLICGSRLGGQDFYYDITKTGEEYSKGANPSSMSDASLSSMFVLFFTLLVFNGPYLNLWLVSLDYICVQTTARKDFNAFTKFARLLLILLAHLFAVAVAYWTIPGLRDASKSTLTWQYITPGAKGDVNLGFVFLEESVAVATLLVGFLYLAWLRKPKDEEPPKVDIEFFMRLTFFVIACTRAFPSADLSPHVSLYRLFTNKIKPDEWAVRFCSGIFASIIVVAWDKSRRYWDDWQKGSDYTSVQNPEDALTPLTNKWAVEPIPAYGRPATAPPGGRTNPGSSLSISFAKQGTYF